ncbi:MAG: phosphoenolpyruvate--protein phosphotransferase [Planctomycetes bacterium]|nr:phosphoenolpyruvate--protein phosphotransferase [Planctomycetota bacterium]
MNISIKWKILGAFVLAMFLPFCLHLAGFHPFVCLAVGGGFVLLLAGYIYYRIQFTLDVIKNKLIPLGHKPPKFTDTAVSLFQDELSAAMVWTDRFVATLEETASSFDTQHGDLKPIESGEHHVFRGNLSTGDPTIAPSVNWKSTIEFGLAIPLFPPKRNEEIFQTCLKSLKIKLKKMKGLMANTNAHGIIDFQLYFLDDQNFLGGFATLNKDGIALDVVLESLFQDFIQKLEAAKSEYIRSRTKDLVDLKNQLIQEALSLLNEDASQDSRLKGRIILVSHLLPSEVLQFHRCGVAGIISEEGTPSSHTQILLESLEIPSISDCKTLGTIPDGEDIAINVISKKAIVNPNDEERLKVATALEKVRSNPIIKEAVSLISDEQIMVKANINMSHDASRAKIYGADGVGLFRSEIAYLGRPELPDEDALLKSYSEITDAFQDSPVTFRMLDIGGDKLVGVRQSQEDNPCMGRRSMRLLSAHPRLFETQYRAMRKAAHKQTNIIFPMVNGMDELDEIMGAIETFNDKLNHEDQELCPVKYGIMVEVPSIVQRFEDVVTHFDVFNIGTNDLTQYTLAADRNNQDVAGYYSSLHPAIISMIHKICTIGQEHQKEICLCGEVASDRNLLPLWLGLGVRQFSVPFRYIPAVKCLARKLDISQCKALADNALKSYSVSDIERKLADFHRSTVL